MVIRIDIEPTNRGENGVWLHDMATIEKLVARSFPVAERAFVGVPARAVAGNHMHPRYEAFVGGVGLRMRWRDETGLHEAAMTSQRLFIVPPGVAHAVVNHGEAEAMLVAWADGPLVDETPADLS